MTTGTLLGQQVRVVLNVPRHTFLDVTTTLGDIEIARSELTGTLHLRLRHAANGVVIPLIARSNNPYRLTVQGSEDVDVRINAVRPSAGVQHLAPGAASVLLTGPVAVTHTPQTILEGPRISDGGNNSTADNALRIELQVSTHDTDAELTLSMEPL